MNSRILLAMFVCATVALAPALADARAGSSSSGKSSSMGSRGSRTYDSNSAQPMNRSMTTQPQAGGVQPGMAPSPAFAGGGSFFQRHPFLTGLAGGFIGSMLFSHMGYAADATSGGSGLGMVLQLLIIGLLIYFAVRLFRSYRGRALSRGMAGGAPFSVPRSAGAAAAPVQRDRGRDIGLADADLNSFQQIHAVVQEAWSASDLGRLRRVMTPEMLSYFSEELTKNASQGTQNIVSGVELVKGDLSESWEEGDLQYATAYMRWRALDFVARLGRSPGDPDYIVRGDPRTPVEAEEVWTFVRRPGGDWLLSAIQQV
jgi:predicted lipid-binding transport protein (Tim44 family)